MNMLFLRSGRIVYFRTSEVLFAKTTESEEVAPSIEEPSMCDNFGLRTTLQLFVDPDEIPTITQMLGEMTCIDFEGSRT